MKKKKRTSVVFSDVREFAEDYPVWSVADIAAEFGCSTSTVYRALAGGKDSAKTPKKETPERPALGIEIRLPSVGTAEVKLRNGGDSLLGALTLSDEGISYRRPNQKIRGREISWWMLEQLVTLGMMTQDQP